MKRLIIKTALITVATIFAIIITLLIVMTNFFPSVMMEFSSTFGDNAHALKFAKIQYGKTLEEKDLQMVLVYAEGVKDYDTVIEYSKKYFESEEKSEDLLAYANGVFFNALINKDYSEASVFEYAEEYYGKIYGKFSRNNPFDILVVFSSEMSSEFNVKLKEKLESIKANATDENEIKLLTVDIFYVNRNLK